MAESEQLSDLESWSSMNNEQSCPETCSTEDSPQFEYIAIKRELPDQFIDKIEVVSDKDDSEHCLDDNLSAEPKKKKRTKMNEIERAKINACIGEVNDEEKPFVCKLCKKRFELIKPLRGHIVWVHYKKTIRPYKCNICSKDFNKELTYKRHLILHTDVKDFKCDECEMCFHRSGYLQKHKLVHLADRPHKCTECSKVFKTTQALKKHTNRHESNFQHHCEQCGKGFLYSSVLQVHIKTHINIRSHVCESCTKTFKTSQGLRQHLKTHNTEKTHICDICNEGFIKNDHLIKHKLLEHNLGDAPQKYDCEKCLKSFGRKNRLTKHIMVVHEKSALVCPLCGKYFLKQSGLDVHLSMHKT